MKKSRPFLSRLAFRFLACIGAAVVCFQASPSLFAGVNASAPAYTPVIYGVNGIIPFTRTYVLDIYAPDNLPAGVNTQVSFAPQVNQVIKPAGVADATALSYLSFSPSTVTFTGPTLLDVLTGLPVIDVLTGKPTPQKRSVTVTLTVPADATPGGYGYQIYTTGWPTSVPILDGGAALNMTISAQPNYTPPAVNIQAPVDLTELEMPFANRLLQVPLKFSASASDDFPIRSVSADLNGTPLTLNTPVGLNTANVDAEGTMTITAPGTYFVTAKAVNEAPIGQPASGQGLDVAQFKVILTGVPGPTVAITKPIDGATYTYYSGSGALNIPFETKAVSSYGGIRTLVATLDGDPVPNFSTTALGQLNVTGTAALLVDDGGTHTLSVTTTDDYGTDTDMITFTVNVITPTPAIDITAPADGAVLLTSSSALNVPFSFKTTTSTGFQIESVSLTLNNVSVPAASISTPGLNTAGITSTVSTGTLTALPVGSYTLVATGLSGGVSVTDSISFTVKSTQQAPQPPTVAINQPPINSTYTIVKCGPSLNIPFSFTGLSTSSAGITKLSATLDGYPLTVTKTGIGSSSATGSGTMVVSTAGTHTLAVTATDAIGTASTTRKFTVVVVTPTLALSINQPTSSTVITRVQGSAATSVPFSFVANETYGTVTSLSATINCNSVAITSSGLNTASATGTGTFTVKSAGTYTFSATAKGTGGLSKTVTVKFTVVETPPPPPPATYKVTWIQPSSTCGTLKGGSNTEVSFQIQKTTQSNSGCGSSTTAVKDTTAVVSIYEIYSNGSTGTPKFYTYTSGSLAALKFTIDRYGKYYLNFPTSSGAHRYHIDVDIFPTDSTGSKLVGTKEFLTK